MTSEKPAPPPSEPNALFRIEAIEARRTHWLGSVVLAQPISFPIYALIAAITGLLLLTFLFFGSYTQRISISGQLLPASGWSKVYPQQGGVVVEKQVSEGQAASKGATLYVLSLDRQSGAESGGVADISQQVAVRRTSLQVELAKTETLHREQRSALVRKIAAFEAELSVINQSVAGQKSRVDLAQDTLARYQGLLQKDFIAAEQVQMREADLIDQKSRFQALERDRLNAQRELAVLRGDLDRLPLEQSKQIGELKRGIAMVSQELTESDMRRRIVIAAPQDGMATAVTAELGQHVDPARPVLSIVPPEVRLQAVLLAPSRAVGFVRKGDAVWLRLDAYPYQKFGHIPARISQVAQVALAGVDLSVLGGVGPGSENEPLYRITADLDSQFIVAYGEQRSLQVGMALQADILQERRKLYEWALEPLMTLTGKL